MATLEKCILAEALAQNDQRTGNTVQELGINQRTRQKIKQYQITSNYKYVL